MAKRRSPVDEGRVPEFLYELVPVFATAGRVKVLEEKVQSLRAIVRAIALHVGADKELLKKWNELLEHKDPWPGATLEAGQAVAKSIQVKKLRP